MHVETTRTSDHSPPSAIDYHLTRQKLAATWERLPQLQTLDVGGKRALMAAVRGGGAIAVVTPSLRGGHYALVLGPAPERQMIGVFSASVQADYEYLVTEFWPDGDWQTLGISSEALGTVIPPTKPPVPVGPGPRGNVFEIAMLDEAHDVARALDLATDLRDAAGTPLRLADLRHDRVTFASLLKGSPESAFYLLRDGSMDRYRGVVVDPRRLQMRAVVDVHGEEELGAWLRAVDEAEAKPGERPRHQFSAYFTAALAAVTFAPKE